MKSSSITWGLLARLRRSSLLQRGIVYTGSSAANGLINLALLPVLTTYLTPADYGSIETYLSLSALFVGVSILGSNTTLSREYFNLEREDRAKYIGSAVGLAGLITVILGLIALVIRFFPNNFLLDQGSLILASAAVFAGGARAVFSIYQTVLQLEKRAKRYAFAVNLNSIGDIAISLALIGFFGFAWKGRLLGSILMLATSVALALAWLHQRRMIAFGTMRFYKRILRSAPALLSAHVAGWGLTLADRIIMARLLGHADTGIYGVGARVASAVSIASTAISLAWLPFFYENINAPIHGARIKIVKATYIIAFILFGIALLYAIVASWSLCRFVDARYYGADRYVTVLCFAYAADGIWKLFTGYLIVRDRIIAYSAISVGCAVLNVVLDLTLVRCFGAIGAAWATLISLLTGALLTIVVAARIQPMPWALRQSA